MLLENGRRVGRRQDGLDHKRGISSCRGDHFSAVPTSTVIVTTSTRCVGGCDPWEIASRRCPTRLGRTRTVAPQRIHKQVHLSRFLSPVAVERCLRGPAERGRTHFNLTAIDDFGQ